MRRVLDHRQAELEQWVEVGGLAGEVDREDRLRALRDACGGKLGIDVEVVVAHVDEDGRRARVDDHVRGRGPGDRRRDHLVARPDAEGDEREMQGRSPGGEREHVLGLEKLRHPAL